MSRPAQQLRKRTRLSAPLALLALAFTTLTFVAAPQVTQQADAVTGTTVFSVDFGTGAGRDPVSTATGTPLVTATEGWKVALSGSYLQGTDYASTNDRTRWNNDADPPHASWTVDDLTNTTAPYSAEPGASDMQFTVTFAVDAPAATVDSTNIFQKGLFSGSNQYKLQIHDHAPGTVGFPECRFQGNGGLFPDSPPIGEQNPGDGVNNIVTADKDVPSNAVVPISGMGTFHTVTCIKETNRIGIIVDGNLPTWKTVNIGNMVNFGQPIQMFDKLPGSHTSDACAYCQMRHADVVIATPTPNANVTAADDNGNPPKVLDVEFDKSSGGSALANGTEWAYFDRSTYQHDVYNVAGDVTTDVIEAGTTNHALSSPGPLVTGTGLAGLDVAAKRFRIEARVKLGGTHAVNKQVIFAKGGAAVPGEGNVRARIQAGGTTPECVFRDTAGDQTIVPAIVAGTSVSLGTTAFHTVGCFRDSNGFGITVDGVAKGEKLFTSLTPTVDSLASPKPFILMDDQTPHSASAVISGQIDTAQVQIIGPATESVPWSGGAWTAKAKYELNSTGFNNTNRTVPDSVGTLNATINGDYRVTPGGSAGGWDTFTDGAAQGLRLDARTNADIGSNFTIPDTSNLIDPTTLDFMVQERVKVRAQGTNDPVTFVQKGSTGQFYKMRLNKNGRADCIVSGSTGAKTATSSVFIRDNTWHTISCARYGSNVVVVVDSSAVVTTGAVGTVNSTETARISNKGQSGGGQADQNWSDVDWVRFYRVYS